jgi:CheY-like chemotaxis protein
MYKYKIIAVENDEDEQFFMKEGFDAAGLFEMVAQVKNGDALLAWLKDPKNEKPDLILSDLNMPGKNGYDIIAFVKEDPELSHIPVVITSTSTAKTIIDKCRDAGAAEYIIKPDTFIEYEDFSRRLHKLVEEKKLIKTNS